ncbi:hypothetical protein BKA65DRAFT_575068 [Rhexocercosporidium sp. MPI-PUGE-AT-0058]|nr:hypothetical protein BKA65DRAFT_575068 [Rhexocercosporidium sp. MPI-PUGE-AT-0058]
MSSNTIILITGANTGLGLETVKSLCQSEHAYTILLAGRSIDKANAAAKTTESEFPSTSSTIRTVQIDIEDDESITQAFKHVSTEYGRLDVLVNNAGGQFDYVDGLSAREMWTKSWSVNVSSTYILTSTFVPLLLKSSTPRIIFLASGTSSLTTAGNSPLPIDKSPAAGWPKEGFAIPAYRASKTGLNMVVREFARMLKNDGVRVWGVSPGFLATGLGLGQEASRKMGALEPKVGANFVRSVVEGERDADVGLVVKKGDVQPF